MTSTSGSTGITESDQRLEAHVDVGSTDHDAVALLQAESGLSRGRVKSAMTKGAAWITRGRHTQRLRRAKRALRVGDELHLYYDPRVLEQVPAAPELIADLGSYTVWNKPFGLRSQGSKWGDHCTVARWAEQHLEPERSSYIVHRLDRAATGLILLAHARQEAAELSALFRERRIEKRYRVQVAGDFSTMATPYRFEAPIDGKPAVSEFQCIAVEGDTSLVDVSIETGRKHQIRRHLAELGFPVLGDRLYGQGEADGVDLKLSAYLLKFDCPLSGEPVEYRLPTEP